MTLPDENTAIQIGDAVVPVKFKNWIHWPVDSNGQPAIGIVTQIFCVKGTNLPANYEIMVGGKLLPVVWNMDVTRAFILD